MALPNFSLNHTTSCHYHSIQRILPQGDGFDENGNLILRTITKETETLSEMITKRVDGANATMALMDDQGLKFSQCTDVAIGVLAIALMIVAVLGNAMSFLYFRRKVQVSLPIYLYAIISAVDFCEASLSFPVIDSLLNTRSPKLFNQTSFCIFWAMAFSYFRRISMIMVMVVCLTRAIATCYPFRNIRTRIVLITIVSYAGLILAIDIVYLSTSWLKTRYRPNESFCEIYPTSITAKAAFYSVLLQLEFIIPCLVVVASFFVCTVSLTAWRTESRRQRGRRRATITIAIFSFVFLVCNIPVFVVQLDYLLAQFTSIRTVDDFEDDMFLGWYSHLLSHFLLSLLNTALNPCLYFLRMPNYRQWLLDIRTDPHALVRRRSKSMITISQRSSSVFSTIDTIISFRRSRNSSLTNSSSCQRQGSRSSSVKRNFNITELCKAESANRMKLNSDTSVQ